MSPLLQEAEALAAELSEVVQHQKLRMRGLAQEKAEAAARLAAMNPQVCSCWGAFQRRAGMSGDNRLIQTRLTVVLTFSGDCLGIFLPGSGWPAGPNPRRSSVSHPLAAPQKLASPLHRSYPCPALHTQELERVRGELLTLRERAGELGAIRDQLVQERRLSESLQQRLAAAAQQLVDAREEAARCVFVWACVGAGCLFWAQRVRGGGLGTTPWCGEHVGH